MSCLGNTQLSSQEADVCLGDLNGDEIVNLLDVAPFVDVLSDGTFVSEADMNLDGVVNLLDIGPFIVFLSGEFSEPFELFLDGGGAIVTERFGINANVPATEQYAIDHMKLPPKWTDTTLYLVLRNVLYVI